MFGFLVCLQGLFFKSANTSLLNIREENDDRSGPRLNKSKERRVRKAKGEIPRSQDKGRKPELQPTQNHPQAFLISLGSRLHFLSKYWITS